MKFLLNIDPETFVTEEIIFRALKITAVSYYWYSWLKEDEKIVLKKLFDRSSDIAVTQKILQAERFAADMRILLKHLKPDTRIFIEVIAAIFKIKKSNAYLTMGSLFKFDFSIRLDLKMALQTIQSTHVIDALKMLLKHDPSMPMIEKMFLHFFEIKFHREKLADLMHKYKIHLVFTDKMRKVIDQVYQSKRDAAKKKQFYSLIATDENGIEFSNKDTKRKRLNQNSEPGPKSKSKRH